MINIRSILKLAENDGMTLKNGNKIVYKSGWQVATEGVECKTAREAINAVKAYMVIVAYGIAKAFIMSTKASALTQNAKLWKSEEPAIKLAFSNGQT